MKRLKTLRQGTKEMKTREGYYSEQNRDGSFISILDKLSEMQYRVFTVIEKNEPIGNEEIAMIMNKYPHEVTPRVKELREKELVEYAGEGRSERSGRKISLWRVVPETQLKMF